MATNPLYGLIHKANRELLQLQAQKAGSEKLLANLNEAIVKAQRDLDALYKKVQTSE